MEKNPTVGLLRDPGHSLTRLLAEELCDSEWWAKYAARSDSRVWRETLSARALRLYRETAPTMQLVMSQARPPEPVDLVVSILRNMADAFALESRPTSWTGEERAQLAIPTRTAILQQVRAAGLYDLLKEFDCVLDDEEDNEAFLPPPSPTHRVGLDAANEFAEAASRALQAFDGMMALPNGRAKFSFLTDDVSRDNVCEQLAAARLWIAWAQGLGEPAVLVASVVMRYITQMLYVVSRDQDSVEILYPDQSSVRHVLVLSGASVWMADHGATLPDWLAGEADSDDE